MTLTRRVMCQAAVATVVAALTGCAGGRYQGDERTVRIAGGQRGGFYLEVARLLAGEISSAEPNLRCTALETGGSVQNVQMISSGQADIGVSQSDVAIAAVTGSEPFAGVLPLRGIGRMYEDYLQLVVLADSEFTTVFDLAGRTVSLGAHGSGATLTGQRLISAVGIRVGERFALLTEAVDALADRRVDALVWSGGVPTPILAALHRKVGIRLLPLGKALPMLRERYGMAYQQVTIPAGGYGGNGMPGIGVPNLLLCDRSLPDDVVATITRVVVEHAAQLVPPQALGTQFLDRRALICLLGVPMHPGAASAYQQLHG
jgi:TRAP transporter TAXI family solute receptor